MRAWPRRLAILLAGAVLVASCGSEGERRPARASVYAVDLGARAASFERAGWRTDFSRHTVSLAEIRRGGPS
jgi:hypothetical protein